ncbi:FtsW/RodA/SpoVE family cell cycle protein, partial [Candidatus Pelagibacter sp.]|nr:FtsW/RodA/SpoVE family cell cycle protein [Candidatus Pelagibacter sp.]
MFSQTSYTDQITFFQKIRSIDYILLVSILLIGIISGFSMYSTDGGELLYHSKSHILRFGTFFLMMIFLSFINIKFWHSVGYIFYIIILALLLWASIYGITASGSQRWVSLYFINIQPSELMKIAIIICLAKYYHRSQLSDIGSFKN